jgi:hypothetical protein
VRLRYTDLDGKVHEEEASGLYATCIQHEIDHLNGVLFVDHISKLKRDRVIKKFTKAAKRAARSAERAPPSSLPDDPQSIFRRCMTRPGMKSDESSCRIQRWPNLSCRFD